jgi:hypothetical protein
MILVGGLEPWRIVRRRSFLLIRFKFPPRHGSCSMPPSILTQLKGELPRPIVELVASRTILHGAPALAELAVTIGALDPADRRTQATLAPIVEMLTRINPSRIVVPNYEIWLEAAVMAAILARTQGIPKHDRRKFLNDTLLFLQAADSGAVIVSRNSRDLDLLLQIKPRVPVLLYDKC